MTMLPAHVDGMDDMTSMRSSGQAAHTVEVTGILWQTGSSFGSAELLDGRTLLPVARVNAEDVRRLGLRQGDYADRSRRGARWASLGSSHR